MVLGSFFRHTLNDTMTYGHRETVPIGVSWLELGNATNKLLTV